jgi:hypothetical protein
MENKWMPKIAGILDIVAGAFGLFIILIWALWFAAFTIFSRSGTANFHGFPMSLMAIVFIPMAIFMFIASILAIVGGIYALKRKMWRLALAGSIAGFFGSQPLGVAAIIFTALSKSEFE